MTDASVPVVRPQFEAEQEALFGGSFEDMCRQLEREMAHDAA